MAKLIIEVDSDQRNWTSAAFVVELWLWIQLMKM